MAVHNVGSDVEAYCSKCKLVLAHVIVAVSGNRIARVECKTCRNVHAYRKSVPGTTTAGSRRERSQAHAAALRSSANQADYERVIKGHDLQKARPYGTTVSFAEGEIINHTSFGLGMVMRLMADNKIEVLFPTGVKVMAHARPSSAVAP